MLRIFRHRRLTSWIAILAVLLTVIAPGLSHAMSKGGSSLIDVCTADGLMRVPASETPSDGGVAPDIGASCAYCLTHAFGFALPPVDVPSWLDLPQAAALRERAPTSHHVRFSPWSASRSRAPPLA